MAVKSVGSDIHGMKTIKLLTLIGAAILGLGPVVWAGPRGGGGFSGGSHFGGNPGGIRAGPAFSGGARFSGRSIGGLSQAPEQFSYYRGAGVSSVGPRASVRQLPNRSIT